MPIIDTHIHLFDKTRPSPPFWPPDVPGGGEPPQGVAALASRYKAIAAPFGVTAAIVVESGNRLEDNDWHLEHAEANPIIVGVIGRIDLGDPAFARNLERFAQNKLFIGIRQYWMRGGIDPREHIGNIKRLVEADFSLDIDMPRHGLRAPELAMTVIDTLPSLRVVLDHLPDTPYHVHEFYDRAARKAYVDGLEAIAKHSQVCIKLSEVVHRHGNSVPTDLSAYKDWLDTLWSLFGEDRVMFGSDWPQSELQQPNSFPNVFGIARAYVSTKGPEALEKVFWSNSKKPYRWMARDVPDEVTL
jgi:predicted TIM-barrel fold metal-dependent hydrolase